MKAILFLALFSALTVVLAPAAARADQVDNPQFVAWSKCGVGSSVTFQQTAAGAQATLEIKKTLKEKADDHVTLEDSTKIMGATDVPAQTRSEPIPAKLDKLPDQKPMPNETIQIGDKKVACKVSEIETTTTAGVQMQIRFWTSDQVPGGLVKMVASTDADGKDVIASIQVKEFDKK